MGWKCLNVWSEIFRARWSPLWGAMEVMCRSIGGCSENSWQGLLFPTGAHGTSKNILLWLVSTFALGGVLHFCNLDLKLFNYWPSLFRYFKKLEFLSVSGLIYGCCVSTHWLKLSFNYWIPYAYFFFLLAIVLLSIFFKFDHLLVCLVGGINKWRVGSENIHVFFVTQDPLSSC